ncbi:hypothetical protein [Natrinema salinisoli]|uniref:hypothetical protein n=1 Tax=Natrinema salinisoli TaxID=2878535 RepID=UPI001CF053EE|nr:hypothetical protein [Natrinema salinisoli]
MTSEDGRRTTDGTSEGATPIEFAEIRHFPMSEHPELCNASIREILATVAGDREEALPNALEPDDVGIELVVPIESSPTLVPFFSAAGRSPLTVRLASRSDSVPFTRHKAYIMCV